MCPLLDFYLNRAVVLSNFNGLFATGGEVLWLRQVATETMVLQCCHVVLHTNPLLPSYVWIVSWPQLRKVGYNMITPKNGKIQKVLNEYDPLSNCIFSC